MSDDGSPPLTRLGRRLEEIRQENGLSMPELAKRLEKAGYRPPRAEKVNWQNYQYLIRSTNPSDEALLALQKVYGLTDEQLDELVWLRIQTAKDVQAGIHPRSGRRKSSSRSGAD